MRQTLVRPTRETEKVFAYAVMMHRRWRFFSDDDLEPPIGVAMAITGNHYTGGTVLSVFLSGS